MRQLGPAARTLGRAASPAWPARAHAGRGAAGRARPGLDPPGGGVFSTRSREVATMKNPYLVGDKIYLRPLEPSDAPAMVPWLNDPDVTRTLASYRPMTE